LIILTITEPKKDTASKADSKSSEDETTTPKEQVVEEPYLSNIIETEEIALAFLIQNNS